MAGTGLAAGSALQINQVDKAFAVLAAWVVHDHVQYIEAPLESLFAGVGKILFFHGTSAHVGDLPLEIDRAVDHGFADRLALLIKH